MNMKHSQSVWKEEPKGRFGPIGRIRGTTKRGREFPKTIVDQNVLIRCDHRCPDQVPTSSRRGRVRYHIALLAPCSHVVGDEPLVVFILLSRPRQAFASRKNAAPSRS